jgi:hypothetical protein
MGVILPKINDDAWILNIVAFISIDMRQVRRGCGSQQNILTVTF